MYINQCGGLGLSEPQRPEPCYVPNNPLFGVPLEIPQPGPHSHSTDLCTGGCGECSVCQDGPLGSADDFVDCGSCLDHNGVLSVGNSGSCGPVGSYWTDEMNSFPGLPPLELDPLPSLFPFSPCQSTYKSERPTHDMADVLLSLKHAVLRPDGSPEPMMGPMGPMGATMGGQYGGQPQQYMAAPQASLSYTVHPQMLVSPATGPSSGYAQGYYEPQCTPCPPCQGTLQHCTTTVFPAMSVNVSMNMTMHGYAENPGQTCSQMQWGSQASPPSVNVLYPPLLSPGPYGTGATYSFTADFRPPAPPLDTTKTQPPQQRHFPHVGNNPYQTQKQQTFSPCLQMKQTRPDKLHGGLGSIGPLGDPLVLEDEDTGDSSEPRPNLCRLCGKTYARPSTLKTHLRTHSGERPYRCPDCNKSFSQAANLTAHVRTHTGQKPFRCPICDRRFSQSSSVTTHMRTHSGERPYRCRACKKAFSDSSTLTKHLRIHSGEKPYQCKLCLLRFSQSGNLNRHMRVHGNNNSALLS